jgi:RimJ/RimL family protein N-acetyltransferase
MKTVIASEKTEPGLNARLAEWGARHIWQDGDRKFGPCCTMGVTENDRLVAVVVYHNYEPDAGVVELSSAATTKRWMPRQVLYQMFETAFVGLDCQLVVLRVKPSDKSMQRMLKAYGFQCYSIPRLRGRFEDDLIFTLTDDAWRTNKFNMKDHHSGKKCAQAA